MVKGEQIGVGRKHFLLQLHLRIVRTFVRGRTLRRPHVGVRDLAHPHVGDRDVTSWHNQRGYHPSFHQDRGFRYLGGGCLLCASTWATGEHAVTTFCAYTWARGVTADHARSSGMEGTGSDCCRVGPGGVTVPFLGTNNNLARTRGSTHTVGARPSLDSTWITCFRGVLQACW